jgi:acyl carrier protein
MSKGGETMDRSQITAKIKDIIANVAGIDRDAIVDDARFGQELRLDSLSRLEIGVDVDYAFKLKLPDESYRGIEGLTALVDLVERRLTELQTAGSAA